jgi:putative membrane protein
MPPVIHQPFPPIPFQRGIKVMRVGFGLGPSNTLETLLLWIVLAAVVFLILSMLMRGRGSLARGANASSAYAANAHRGSGAREILDERFARGEIDADDYTRRKDLLSRHS